MKDWEVLLGITYKKFAESVAGYIAMLASCKYLKGGHP